MRLPRRFDGDLLATMALILAGLTVTVAPAPDWLRAAVFVPLVLLAPGYAVAAALFPRGRLGGEERLVLALALSVATWALLGILVQAGFDLGRGSWLAIAAFATFGGALVAQLRRGESRPPHRPRRRLRATPVLSIAIAIAIVGVAISIASAGQHRELNRSHFTALWIAPPLDSGAPPGEEEVTLGVQNHEGESAEYRLSVSRRGRRVTEWHFTLQDREVWTRRVLTPVNAGFLVATLYRDGRVYHRVALEPEEPA